MCGIAGEYRFDGKVADVGAVATMSEAQHARGPDGNGVLSFGPSPWPIAGLGSLI
ncbi:MAG: hypothetical protein IPJ88_18020 [Myxococcales bacterium]|nr:MAG: hypothetical protein IPJ88_18020 [Myxococcales bacterium]